MHPKQHEIAYVLKAFGRTSETFITNEIHLLETLGLRLSIFSFKRLSGEQEHASETAIKAPVDFLPEIPSRAGMSFSKWLRTALPGFRSSHLRLFIRRPLKYLGALQEAIRLSIKYGSGLFRPETSFAREFLQAGYIAERVRASGNIRHLHAHFAHTSTTVAMLASRLSGVPFSFTAHAKDIYRRDMNPGDLLQRKIGRAQFVVTCTKANKDYLRVLNPKGAPIHTIYHGLDTTKFSPLTSIAQRDGQVNMPLILSAGRLVEKKGFPYLVAACRQLRDGGYNFHCRIVGGEGADAERTRAMIGELKLDDLITLSPPVTQEELARIYRQATVFVLPCQILPDGDRDGIPNVLVEAMASETPVVSTIVSGISELIEDGVTGLLVPQRDASALAGAIERLLNDDVLRRRLGKAARKKVCELFDAREHIVHLHHLYLSHIEGNG